MAILVVAGDPGNGKGVYAMSLIEQAARARRAVYTNIALREACPYFDRVALIDDEAGEYPVYRGTPGDGRGKPPSSDYCAFWHYVRRGSVVIIDEADAYFDCSDHSQMGRDVRIFLKQHRKRGLDIVFIVQRIENLYVRIRRLAQRFIVCEWTWRSQRFWQWLGTAIGRDRAIRFSRFYRSEFSSERFGRGSYLGDGYISYSEAVRYFGWYSTEQLLGDTSYLKDLGE